MLYIENPVPNDIVRRRKPQYIILLDGVLSLSLPNVYQKKRESAGKQGFPAFPFSGCLPDVYQGDFLREKPAGFSLFFVF